MLLRGGELLLTCTNLCLRVVELLLVLGNLLHAVLKLRGSGIQLLFAVLDLGGGGVNLGVRLVELGFCFCKLGGGGERVGDRIHGGHLAGQCAQCGGECLLLLFGEGGAVTGGENDLAGAAVGAGEALCELVGELLGLRSGHGEGVAELAVERGVGTRYTGNDECPDEDDSPCATGGGFTDAVEPCSHDSVL